MVEISLVLNPKRCGRKRSWPILGVMPEFAWQDSGTEQKCQEIRRPHFLPYERCAPNNTKKHVMCCVVCYWGGKCNGKTSLVLHKHQSMKT
jgi:hypothetical protein